MCTSRSATQSCLPTISADSRDTTWAWELLLLNKMRSNSTIGRNYIRNRNSLELREKSDANITPLQEQIRRKNYSGMWTNPCQRGSSIGTNPLQELVHYKNESSIRTLSRNDHSVAYKTVSLAFCTYFLLEGSSVSSWLGYHHSATESFNLDAALSKIIYLYKKSAFSWLLASQCRHNYLLVQYET